MFNRFQWSPGSLRRNRMTAVYEPVQPFLFCAFLNYLKATTVFDVGANIGQYSIFSRQVPSVTKIHAFEAEQAAYSEMLLNIALNGLEELINPQFKAVSDVTGEVEFAVAKPMGGNNAIASTSIHSAKVYKEYRKVPSIALDDDHVMTGSSLGFKIDVEGHEAEVVEGAAKLLRNNRCILQIEMYGDVRHAADRLENLGFRRIFAAGVDVYFTNCETLLNPSQVITVAEEALAAMIHHSLKG